MPDQEEPSKTVDSNVDGAAAKTDNMEKVKSTGLAVKGTDRSRSRSRHSAVIDKGQATASEENLAKVAPSNPNLAEATILAPERHASPLPSPISDPGHPHPSLPGIVISDNPQSPDTLIPATETLTTRPTKGGIAYPFSLRVDDEGREVNASTLTLQSVGIPTPAAVEVSQGEKDLGAGLAVASNKLEPKNVEETKFDEKQAAKEEQERGRERPGVERFFTAVPGAGVTNGAVEETKISDPEKMERPGVERFETAQENLDTLASGNKA